MEADRGVLIGQMVGGIVGLAIAGFIIFRVIQAIAAFVSALKERPKESTDEGNGDDTSEGV